MHALSIRQPFAELILRGIKTVEYRSRPVGAGLIGKRFYIYAAKAKARPLVWSEDLRAARPPEWMVELAKQVKLISSDAELPTGVIVGSAVIARCEKIGDERAAPGVAAAANDEITAAVPPARSSFIVPKFRWHLVDVERATRLQKPSRRPQPCWFHPF